MDETGALEIRDDDHGCHHRIGQAFGLVPETADNGCKPPFSTASPCTKYGLPIGPANANIRTSASLDQGGRAIRGNGSLPEFGKEKLT